MAKNNGKVKSKAEKLPKHGRREYVIASGHKFVINDGVVSLVDADDELIISVDNDRIIVRRDKVTAVVEDDVVDAGDSVTPVGAEWEDETFRQHNVYEKLIAQTKNAKPSSNWRAELDEL
jgi:hypothetical protein